MAIQTIGGAAASATITGTPVFKIQRASATSQGYYSEEFYLEYGLQNPLPPGNYFFTLLSSGGFTQAIIGLDNGTIATALNTASSTVSGAYAVPAGRTITKIWFRRPANYSWATNINLDILVSTDTASFSGAMQSVANSYKIPSIPPLPTGYSKVTNAFSNATTLDKTGTYTYFVAGLTTSMTLSTSYPATNFGANHNVNLNSILKFYEFNYATGALTEKAQPIFNSTTTLGLGWNPNSNPSNGSSWSASITHMQNAYCLVADDYVYLDPGSAQGGHYGSYNYTMDYPYGKMGRYNKSTNTWTEVDSKNTRLYGIQNYWNYAIAGNKFVVCPTLYYRNSYNSPDTINLYQYNWYTQDAINNVYWYNPTTNLWSSAYTQRSTASGNFPRNPYNSTASTDRYVVIDTGTSQISPGSNSFYFLDTNDGTISTNKYVQPLTGDFGNNNSTTYVHQFGQNSMWFKHPTDGTKYYIWSPATLNFYLVNFDQFASASAGAYLNNYMTRVKWKGTNLNQQYYGMHYISASDRLIMTNTFPTPNSTSTQTNVSYGYELIPSPTELTSYY